MAYRPPPSYSHASAFAPYLLLSERETFSNQTSGKVARRNDGIVCDHLLKALVESKPQSVLNCNKSRELLQQSIFTLTELE